MMPESDKGAWDDSEDEGTRRLREALTGARWGAARVSAAAALRAQEPWDADTTFEECLGDIVSAANDGDTDLDAMLTLQEDLARLIDPVTLVYVDYVPGSAPGGAEYVYRCAACTGELERRRPFGYRLLPRFCPHCGRRVLPGGLDAAESDARLRYGKGER